MNPLLYFIAYYSFVTLSHAISYDAKHMLARETKESSNALEPGRYAIRATEVVNSPIVSAPESIEDTIQDAFTIPKYIDLELSDNNGHTTNVLDNVQFVAERYQFTNDGYTVPHFNIKMTEKSSSSTGTTKVLQVKKNRFRTRVELQFESEGKGKPASFVTFCERVPNNPTASTYIHPALVAIGTVTANELLNHVRLRCKLALYVEVWGKACSVLWTCHWRDDDRFEYVGLETADEGRTSRLVTGVPVEKAAEFSLLQLEKSSS